MRVERERTVTRPDGSEVEIVVTKRGQLYINGVNTTERFENRTIDRQLMDELELRAEAGYFDDVQGSLLDFLRA